MSISSYKTGRSTSSSPQYCAVTGHIAKYIGFEILLPTKTWHERYLQVGCGGLCGSIGVSPPQSSDYKPLAKGYFVVAAEDDGHSGDGTAWYSNPRQRVDFAYLSYHELAVVSNELAKKFYGAQPKYSYFDGCSQGGHKALGDAQRYPKDFNGVVAGAPASRSFGVGLPFSERAVMDLWLSEAWASSPAASAAAETSILTLPLVMIP